MTNNQTLSARKVELLQVFFQRYDWRLPLELTPSDSTFQVVARVRKRRSAEFIPLSRVSSAADIRDVQVGHIRIKGTNGDLLLDPSKTLSKKSTDFTKNTDAFNFSVKILMYAYVLASCGDEKADMWCPLQSAMKHITVVENHSRAAARVHTGLHPRIAEAEMAVRREWHAIGQAEPNLNLATLIELVSQRHSIWPIVSELRSVTRPDKGKGKGKDHRSMSFQDRKWWAEENGETLIADEICRGNSSAEGCRMTGFVITPSWI